MSDVIVIVTSAFKTVVSHKYNFNV